ncbi:MAG: toll/interleukin-1 receptor domain-containing protein [Chitinophagaceae bacterium]
MSFELFISYTNKDPDKIVAERLYNELNTPYFPVFLDKKRLDAGYSWNNQLNAELKSSKHLVVVWSSKANQSQWVQREIAFFSLKENSESLIFPVCMDIGWDTYPQQAILDIKEAGFYPAKMDLFDQYVIEIVNKIKSSIYKKYNSKPIKRAVFTMTLNKLLMADLKEERRVSIENNYGTDFSDWKPFGSNSKITEILDKLLYEDINQKTFKGKQLFHWEDIDWKTPNSKLWLNAKDANSDFIDANTKATADEINKLEASPCVVLLDPYALNDKVVKERFMRASDRCMDNNMALIMALNSHPLTEQLQYLRKQLQIDAEKFYHKYFEPGIPSNPKNAECFANTIDDLEVKRNLRVALRNIVNYDNATSNSNNAVTHGNFN